MGSARSRRSGKPQGVGGKHGRGMRLGIAHHLGWAVAVTASADHKVVDRRRIELIEPGVPTAPIHHEGGSLLLHRPAEPLDDKALAALVADVRASVSRAASAALEEIATALSEPITSHVAPSLARRLPRGHRRSAARSLREPRRLRHVPPGAGRARRERGWVVHHYDAKDVEVEAVRTLGNQADKVLHGPRASLGPPWSKDHRMALAATIVVT